MTEGPALTLEHILTLSGRLNDEPRFDGARERFRRFLFDYVRDATTARDLIEQGQYAPSDEHQRAIQDLVVLSGRFLGFKPAFGPDPCPAPMGHCGIWQSPSHLHVLIDVRSDQATPGEPGDDPLLAAAPGFAAGASAGYRPAALCVVTPLCMNRHKIGEAFAAARPGCPIGVFTLRSLLSLADSVSAGRMSHDDLVRLIESNMSLDFMVELLDRASASSPAGDAASSDLQPNQPPLYWMCNVASDHDTKPEEFLELVVARRLIFGIASDIPSAHAIRTGDGICFYIAGKGTVGHARIASPADVGRGLRDAHRFRQVLQLEDLHLYLDRPVAADFETQLRFRTARVSPSRHVQTVIEISRDSFQAMTRTDAPRTVPISGASA